MLTLAHGFAFPDLYERGGLLRLDAAFGAFLRDRSPSVAERLTAARAAPGDLARKAHSELLLELAPHLETFIAELFGIEGELEALRAGHLELAPLYAVKRNFVQRRAQNKVKPAEAASFDVGRLKSELEALLGTGWTELDFAIRVLAWQVDEAANASQLDVALRYAAWALHTTAGRERHGAGLLFKTPQKLDPMQLVPVARTGRHGLSMYAGVHLRRREGFGLTDHGTDLAGALDHANYCIWCHEQQKDSCSSGLRERKAAEGGPAPFRKSPFGVTLAGCPLEERISEFHKLKVEGFPIAAFAVITVDNPMVAATGHRICNDCMKSCIYQKQEPVNIPQAETRTLKDVLALPWGFEIYSLLTRWNPLNLHRPLPMAPTGKRVLVAGMGPAGFTLAHHLIQDGHTVVGIDGLKIEPLPAALCGRELTGKRVPFEPIRDVASLQESLDDRVMAGFGGVAEYGITVRWDKNFLKIIRLLLERRTGFALYGGVRIGGTLRLDDAFDAGFDHVSLCMGAGRPTVIDMPNGLARGVRTASDFLMALQLTGAAKRDSVANMQVRLPVVVIGGGLTAIDTATESLAYYPVQVEKFLLRYETLAASGDAEELERRWNAEERGIAMEFLDHARAIREERLRAARDRNAPRIVELLQSWGGVTIAYRKRMVDSPSYTLNHEEIEKALEEGIWFAEELTPLGVEVDAFGHARSIRLQRQTGGKDGVAPEFVNLPARTILIAAGTQPNTVLAREEATGFSLDGRYFAACDEGGKPVTPERGAAKPAHPDVLVHRRSDGRFVSFFGDLHPSFFGNVVKAMGAAKQGYPVVSRVLAGVAAMAKEDDAAFLARLDDDLRPTVHAVIRLTPNIVEVIVRAPRAARRFEPGQFYRLQNFEALSPRVGDTRLMMEGLALTGAWVDRQRGLVSTIVLEMGGSSDLCAQLKPGEPVVLMGPTGRPTEIPSGETVLLAGGGLGNAVLFSIGQALKHAGNRVLYFAGYRRPVDRYKLEEIEAASDVVVWCCDEGPLFEPRRSRDRSFIGNIVDAMIAYASGKLGIPEIPMSEVDRVVAIGSDRMMAAVARARHGALKPYVRVGHRAIGSINSPMQCMMKEICAQCLQEHVDPETGRRTVVFSCYDQDQPLDRVDFAGLDQRLRQNGVQEKLTAAWIAHRLRALSQPAASGSAA